MISLVLLGVCLILIPIALASNETKLLWRAATALHHRDFAHAASLAGAVFESSNNSFAALIVGEARSGAHQHTEAITSYKHVSNESPLLKALAHRGLGERYFILGDLAKAEQHFTEVLVLNPNDFQANKRLAFLMQIQGRSLESMPHAMRMIRQGLFGATEIHIAGCSENRFLEEDYLLDLSRKVRPDELRPLLPEARLYQLKNQTSQARELYQRLVSEKVDYIEPYSRLGRIYLDEGDEQAFLELNANLPVVAEQDATIWVNRGLWFFQNQQYELAAGCYYRSLQLVPHHAEANYLMSQVLSRLGHLELAQEIGQRARLLSRIELTIPEFYDEPTHKRVRELIADFEAVGRYWEAAAMCQFLIRFEAVPPEWVKEELTRFAKLLRQSDGVLFPREFLQQFQEVARVEMPDWSKLSGTDAVLTQTSAKESIRFRNIADDIGLEFTYFNGSLSQRGMEHIFETTGGGTITLDFNADSWPDLYFTQGAPLWKGDDHVVKPDRLFMNRHGEAQDVTQQAGLGDTGFGQGATTGDINNDGFPDLYVCNLHGNRFYENNGDGTFTEITEQTVTAGDEWSLSSVITDLNRDGLADLYVVNYLQREKVFDQRCKQNGHPLTCAPTMFPAEQDRLYLNLGDGSFREVTSTSGIEQPEGKGLAVLAADLDDSQRISLYIGNDTTADFLLKNQTVTGESPKFEEAGIISGLALDGSGRSIATMGIACGDVDRSGSLDIFVTDFFETSNVLYRQVAPGLFEDWTKPAQLHTPSIQLLGFGTEFVDADLDGELDLFVTNGHVDRTFATGEPDEMPPQLYRGHSGGSFELLDNSKIGAYFDGKYLGRSVSRLDWNRDGRDDLAILHLYTPVSLLVNETPSGGHFLRLYLKGDSVDRDAIGTRVVVQAGDETWTHQLVAGDGYMTSNERQVTIGIGERTVVDRISVTWLDGTQTEFTNVKADAAYQIRQSQKNLYFLW